MLNAERESGDWLSIQRSSFLKYDLPVVHVDNDGQQLDGNLPVGQDCPAAFEGFLDHCADADQPRAGVGHEAGKGLDGLPAGEKVVDDQHPDRAGRGIPARR